MAESGHKLYVVACLSEPEDTLWKLRSEPMAVAWTAMQLVLKQCDSQVAEI
jgi:hypothetical protein